MLDGGSGTADADGAGAIGGAGGAGGAAGAGGGTGISCSGKLLASRTGGRTGGGFSLATPVTDGSPSCLLSGSSSFHCGSAW